MTRAPYEPRINRRCRARWCPSGRHAHGYVCTLRRGHRSDHAAHGVPTQPPLMGWGRGEGISDPDQTEQVL